MQINTYPKHIDIDLSSKCNIRCRFCHLTFFDPKEVTELTLNDVKQLEPVLNHLTSITLFSKFEPLTCKEFVPIFNYIKKFNLETYFSTNGLLLSEEISDILVGELTYLTVSVTGFTDKSYQTNMGVDKFTQLKQNLAYLNKKKKEQNTPYPILRISTVGLLDVIDELKMAVDFAKEFEVQEGIQVTSFKSYSEELNQLMPLENIEYFSKVTDDAIQYAKEQKVKFVLQSDSFEENIKKSEELGHKSCTMPWYRISIQPNGDIFPCPVAYEPIGNLQQDNILDIWNSKKMHDFRLGVNNVDNMNEDCINCTHCRHRRITKKSSNDFSKAQKYFAGMKRK